MLQQTAVYSALTDKTKKIIKDIITLTEHNLTVTVRLCSFDPGTPASKKILKILPTRLSTE